MQLRLLCLDEVGLRGEIEAYAGFDIELTITNNSSSIMNFQSRSRGRSASLRVHHMFLTASPDVVRALARWLTRNKCSESAEILDGFIASNRHLIRGAQAKPIATSTRGTYHELQEIYDEVNREHFDDTIDAPITWGRMPSTRRRRRSIRLGSYTPEDHLIRIHPYLDQHFVPRYFVRYIVFHEMLHAHLGVFESPSGRLRVHTPEFRKLEQQYPDYDRAIAWHEDRKNLGRLLHRRPEWASA